MRLKSELMPGTLDMLILRTLTRAPLHGYGIAKSIKQLSLDVLTVEEGSLLPVSTTIVAAGLGESGMEEDGDKPASSLPHPDRSRTQATGPRSYVF
jgi:DNA-binding PadR family transcriptional regulator